MDLGGGTEAKKTLSTLGLGSKGQNIFFLKGVMLHTKLIGMKHSSPRKDEVGTENHNSPLVFLSHWPLRNSYTMGCPPVRGDNPRALASGLSYIQVDKHGITILYQLHQCRPCTSRDISC